MEMTLTLEESKQEGSEHVAASKTPRAFKVFLRRNFQVEGDCCTEGTRGLEWPAVVPGGNMIESGPWAEAWVSLDPLTQKIKGTFVGAFVFSIGME